MLILDLVAMDSCMLGLGERKREGRRRRVAVRETEVGTFNASNKVDKNGQLEVILWVSTSPVSWRDFSYIWISVDKPN